MNREFGALAVRDPGLRSQPCRGEYPQWTHLSSKSGDLPVPGTSKQQTGCLVLDIDKMASTTS